ncbi:MAG: hydantoinase [Ignavibacteriae bacterium]|nr:hydantoinase [Ignavibacteriota bacterium]
MSRKIKIGIDVGGTFTHAVAVDAESLTLVGKAMVPTTHTAAEGVAAGVVQSMHKLLAECRIGADEVVLIAHSTTQATNALLEGDVATVGIIGMGKGAEGAVAKRQTNIDHLELAPGKLLKTHHLFIDTKSPLSEEAIKHAMTELQNRGAEVFVASEAFGIDNILNERKVIEVIRDAGHLATSASEISQLYGLKVRTRTAVINASMMPKMLETANMTEKAVRESGITVPLMIMRSDGGIMDINEMRRRPILTMLSGPAAGVAAALMYAKVSDGVFLEVGGTSTDISVIKNGRPTIRSGEVGGHRLYVRTLDVRTVGIGGGSMPRFKGHRITDVGPRSAHIAGLRYPSFAGAAELENPRLHSVQPKKDDPYDYLAIAVRDDSQPTFTFTTTEAANALGLIKKYGTADAATLNKIATWLVAQFNMTVQKFSERMLEIASHKIIDVVKNFVAEYKLDEKQLTLVGGGGGAEAIVPFTASKMNMGFFIAEDAEVISAIGVALGMIQDTIERSMMNPSEADILNIRSEAMQSVLRMGAAADSIDVRIEVDTKRQRVIATASGSPELRQRAAKIVALPSDQLTSIAARSCGAVDGETRCVGETEFLKVYQAERVERRLFGVLKSTRRPLRVIDREGVIRLKLADAFVHSSPVLNLPSGLARLIDEFTMYGDAGGLQPDVFIIVSGRIIDLSGLAGKEQVLALLRTELQNYSGSENAIALVSKKE